MRKYTSNSASTYVSYRDIPHQKFLFRLVCSKNKLIVLDDAECVSTEYIFNVLPSTGNLILQAGGAKCSCHFYIATWDSPICVLCLIEIGNFGWCFLLCKFFISSTFTKYASLTECHQNISKKNPASLVHVEEQYTVHSSWKVSSHRFIAEWKKYKMLYFNWRESGQFWHSNRNKPKQLKRYNSSSFRLWSENLVLQMVSRIFKLWIYWSQTFFLWEKVYIWWKGKKTE
jgi:hypothetical protein